MKKTKNKHIQVFEHSKLKVSKNQEGLNENHLKALQLFHEKHGDRYYSLIHKGVKFKEYVGAIQVGSLTIEVLPKADRNTDKKNKKDLWRSILINMLRAVGLFNIYAPSYSSLKIRNNSILDLYFEIFIKEVEYLINKGLVRKYRKTENNQLALKGNINFAKNIQKNLVHKERFYIKHSVYDKHHLLHQILYKTILLLKEVNYTFTLGSKINGLLLLFPEMSDINVNEAVFSKIRYNRKTKEYKKAIEISRLLLLNYHPDLSNGRNDVLALMFDMNLLWEEFVLVSLRKNKELNVKGQRKKYFWKPDGGRKRTIRPDIKLSHEEKNYIIDTKWKLVERKPSMDDIRQMYVYHQYFDAEKVALLYPGKKDYISGNYVDKTKQNTLTDMECGLMFTKHTSSVAEWQKEINQRVFDWIKK